MEPRLHSLLSPESNREDLFGLGNLPFSHSQSREIQGRSGGSWSSAVSLRLHWELWPGRFPQRAAQDRLNEGKSTPLIRGPRPRAVTGRGGFLGQAIWRHLLRTNHGPSTGLLRARGSCTRNEGAEFRRQLLGAAWEGMLLCATVPLHSPGMEFGNL